MKLTLFYLAFNSLLTFIFSQVISVNDTNYEEHITENDFVSIYFHAPWSSDSRKIKNHFLGLPQSINIPNIKIQFLETTNKAVRLNHRYDIRGYPTILLIKKDKHFVYKGGMKIQEMAAWIESKVSRTIEEIHSTDNITNLMESDGVATAYIGELNEHYEEFLKAIENFPDYKFHKITNMDLIKNLNIQNDSKNLSPKILIFKTFDDHFNIFSPKNVSQFTSENIVDFVRGYHNPSINPFSSNNHIYVVNNKIAFSILVYNSEKALSFEEDIYPENATVLYKDYYAESLKYRSKLFFMMGNYSDLSQTTLMQDFDFSVADLPLIIVQGFNKEKTRYERFKTKPEELETLNEFFDRYKYRALERFYKSEDVPRNEMLYPAVLKIVRKNFMEKVIESETSFVLFITRRNCGLCNEVIFLTKKFNYFKKFRELLSSKESQEIMRILKI